MTKTNIHCECPEDTVPEGEGSPEWMYDPVTEAPYRYHKANECKCTNDLQLYQDKITGKNLMLCSCCCTFRYEPVEFRN